MEHIVIAFVIIMFVLSQVSERINNMFKLYLPLVFPRWKVVQTLRTQNRPTDIEQKEHERIIFLISLLGGALTTLLFYLTFFSNGATNNNTEAWEYIAWMGKYLKQAWFFVLISIFLSFGSKFWHDILDIIFFYKNAKRALNDPNLYRQESVQATKNIIEQTPLMITEEALTKYQKSLEEQTGVVSVSIGYSAVGTPLIRVRFDTVENAENAPDEYFINDKNGHEHRVIVDKIVSGTIEAHSAEIGGLVFNKNSPNRGGTAGYLFKTNIGQQLVLLSCFHVLRSRHSWSGFAPINEEEICFKNSNGQKGRLGKLYHAGGKEIDAAIATVETGIEFDLDSIPNIKSTGEVSDEYAAAYVKIAGLNATPKRIDAMIYETEVKFARIRYADGKKRTFQNLFSLKSKNSSGQVTSYGDSGALVYHSNGKALGIIIGGNKELSYAIKLSEIEEIFDISIVPKEKYKTSLKSIQ